jgi:hypothetical protein
MDTATAPVITETPVVAKARLVRNTPIKVPSLEKRFSFKQIQQKNRGIEYITIYMRVQRAIKQGLLIKDGTSRGKNKSRRGRSAVMFKANAESI